ncbi:ABC-2 transporter permease [Bacillus sp. TL12]|uniref:ABC-2 transporter permease n=1 Tax=Bacillus sp. TL12 TaxID=2894756 RepID=UPI001F5200CF|nr:ABC-2 transporter permease [Bacillus sp. TL12]MCI0763366.1 ABC-2 transporter permease [Bacillus sp. TL12]
MKQLIMKDFIVQRNMLIWYIMYPFLFYMATHNNHSTFTLTTVIIPVILMMRTFYSDEKNQIEKMFNSLPISRKQIILAKYMFASIILMISVIIAYFTVGIQLRNGTVDFIETTVVASMSLSFIVFSLILPIYFLFGYQKTFMIACFILIAPIFILEVFFKVNIERLNLHSGFLFIGATCMMLLSMIVCTKLYEQRDL